MEEKFHVLPEILQPRLAALENQNTLGFLRTLAINILCFMAYGFSIGCWRSWEMGLFVAIKTPLLIFCTLGCNALLNGLFGVLIGGLRLRESLRFMLNAFASSSLILTSLIPIVLFFTLLLPSVHSTQANLAHSAILFQHVLLIALAGVAAMVALDQILRERCKNPTVARLTLLSWLLGNAILGAQFSWIFRPFFGSPSLEVQFLRPHPLKGNFYESVWKTIVHLSGSKQSATLILLTFATILAIITLQKIHNPKKSP